LPAYLPTVHCGCKLSSPCCPSIICNRTKATCNIRPSRHTLLRTHLAFSGRLITLLTLSFFHSAGRDGFLDPLFATGSQSLPACYNLSFLLVARDLRRSRALSTPSFSLSSLRSPVTARVSPALLPAFCSCFLFVTYVYRGLYFSFSGFALKVLSNLRPATARVF